MSHESNSNTTFNIGDQTRIRLPLMMLIGLVCVVASGAAIFASLRAADSSAIEQLVVHSRVLAEHNDRLRKLEEGQAAIAVIQNDVGWIRRELEKPQRKQP